MPWPPSDAAGGVANSSAVSPRTRSGPVDPLETGRAEVPMSFTVVIPALNEEHNLGRTVETVLREFGSEAGFLEVLVFDDDSTDGTGRVTDELARRDSRVRAFHNPRRLNIGGIYKAGVKEARGGHYLLIPGDNETRVDGSV